MVGKFEVPSESYGKDENDVKKNTFRETMEQINNGQNSVLSTAGLRQLMNEQPFTQIRVWCTKPWHGRVVDIVLINKANLNALLWIGTTTEKLYKGSGYKFLADDTSLLSSVNELTKGTDLYDHFVYSYGLSHVQIYSWDRMECDDDKANAGFKRTGSWVYYVR